ncbi:heme peroxidase [Blyttiomyces helicus]|uniref:Peroxidase n=1 Tax=Blyttiomyces helicus TaxID=388810 RepID=A0A4P9W5T0_9FUNG|nr:heme peroxidase [Blyttiomyces helicus]|eukprot:RKO86268.1 heme peroxidase [Blyttiomyces helicus]
MAHNFFPGSLGIDSAGTSITYPDAMNLAGITTISACGGPEITFGSGFNVFGSDPTGLLPLASDSPQHTVGNMDRMGFTPEQIVAIVTGSHTLGGVHAANSPNLTTEDFAPFDSTPTVFDNNVFKQTLAGNCRIPFDCFLAQNETYRPFVERFAANQTAFFESYVQAFNFMMLFNENIFLGGKIRHNLNLAPLTPPTTTCPESLSERKDCGFVGIHQPQCEAKGCCWSPVSPNPKNIPWCFFKTSTEQQASAAAPAPAPALAKREKRGCPFAV